MRRVRIIVEGNVQGVRFRDYVQKTAIDCNLTGSVENMRDTSVELICEGKDGDINGFVKELEKAKKEKSIEGYPKAVIEKITVLDEKPTGKFPTFEIKYGTTQEELRDQLGAANSILLNYGLNVKTLEDNFGKISSSVEKIDEKYGVISKNLEASSSAITLLANTLTELSRALKEDREIMRSEREAMKNLAKKLDESMTSLSTDIRSLIRGRD